MTESGVSLKQILAAAGSTHAQRLAEPAGPLITLNVYDVTDFGVGIDIAETVVNLNRRTFDNFEVRNLWQSSRGAANSASARGTQLFADVFKTLVACSSHAAHACRTAVPRSSSHRACHHVVAVDRWGFSTRVSPWRARLSTRSAGATLVRESTRALRAALRALRTAAASTAAARPSHGGRLLRRLHEWHARWCVLSIKMWHTISRQNIMKIVQASFEHCDLRQN